MSTSPFVHMAISLTMQPVVMPSWHAESAAIEPGIGRTERIRRLLKSTGAAMTDAEIAWDMADHFPNFGTHLVWLLLKHDISKGRVRMIRHGLYRWCEEYESAEATAIRAAVKLLTKNGYTVKAPAP
jgi:hypothetical protein